MQIIKRFSFLQCILVWALAFTPGMLKAQQQDLAVSGSSRIQIAGTSASLEMPNVYSYDETQGVYVYPGASSGISVKVLEGTSFVALNGSITREGLEQQKMKVEKTEDLITHAGIKAKLYYTRIDAASTTEAKSVEYVRLVFITGNESKSVWITVNYPAVAASLLQEPIMNALLSLEF